MGETNPIIPSTKIETSLPNYAYINREDLTDIVLPESLEKIDKHLFLNCKRLKKVRFRLGTGISSTESRVFYNCQNLVIRNNFVEIIAKSTLYVNKKQGYAGDWDSKQRLVLKRGLDNYV